MSENGAAGRRLACLFGYGLWLNWFLARHALDVTAARAAIVVVCTNVVTTGLIVLPQLADYALNGTPAAP